MQKYGGQLQNIEKKRNTRHNYYVCKHTPITHKVSRYNKTNLPDGKRKFKY